MHGRNCFMKKIVLFLIAAVMVISMSGCSDFGYNPTGHWVFTSDDLYENDKMIDSVTGEDNEFMSRMFLIFEKSGTGYMDAAGLKTNFFRYTYEGDTVTLTFLPNEYNDEEVVSEFRFSQDGKKLIRTKLTEEPDADGNMATYREEYVYSRV